MSKYFFALVLFASFITKSNGTNPPNILSNNTQKDYVKTNTSPNTTIGNHQVFVDVLQLLFKQVTFGYEYIHDSDNVALRIPITMGLGKNYLEAGAELKFFITKPYTFYRKIGPWDAGDANVRYFLGPAASAISVQNDWIGSLRFSNGISMQFIKGLNLSAYGSVGPAMYFTNANGHQNDLFFYWAVNGSIGWRFGGKG